MQITSDERAALERLRRAERDGHLEGAYGSISMTDSWTIMRNADRKTAAALALRLVREDDDSAITEGWLRSVGFTESPNPRYMAIKGKDHAFCCRKSGELTSVMNHGEVFDKTSKEMVVVELLSRGQLRRLASALGIELKEPS